MGPLRICHCPCSCYTVAVNAVLGDFCSATAATLNSLPPQAYTISHPDGRTWKRAGASPWSGNYMNLDTGTTLSLETFVGASVPRSLQGYASLFSVNQGASFEWPGNGYPGTLHSSTGTSLTLFSNPSGGYAIVTNADNPIGSVISKRIDSF